MSDFLDRLSIHAPDKITLSEPGYRITYGDLPSLVRARMEKLQGCRCAALSMNNGIEWVLWDLAALSASVPVVPLPPFFTPEQREHAILSSGCDAAITPEGVIPLGYDPVELPAGTAKITYTSGTTGTPKGVCLSTKAMTDVADSIVSVLGANMAGIHAAIHPLGILLENVAGVYSTLLAGGTVHLCPLESFGLQYANLHGVLKSTGATSVILVPELLRILMEQVSRLGALPDLKYIALGGSKVSTALLMGAKAMNLPVYEGYGLSECASVVAMNTPADNLPGTVGKLLPHIRARIENGEIVIRNPGFLGYIGDTAPSSIHTGDLGAFDKNGVLSITGRKKNVLITSFGRNVSPEWVESELLAQPEIAQAVVYGDGESTLGAFIVPTFTNAKIDLAVARANERLPDYARVHTVQAVPSFTPRDGTLTGTGRPRRSRILELYKKENAL